MISEFSFKRRSLGHCPKYLFDSMVLALYNKSENNRIEKCIYNNRFVMQHCGLFDLNCKLVLGPNPQ